MRSITARGTGRIIAAATAVTMLAALAACSSGSGKNEDGRGKVDGSTITIGTFSPLQSQFQAYANAYMKEYPKRKVKVVGVSADFTKYEQILSTQRISKSMPDIFFNVDFAANNFANDHLAFDIAPFLKEKKDGLAESAFLPQFLGQYRPLNDPDQILGLPVSADSTALVYNKTLFQKAGVTEYPTSDWTWSDFFRVASEIQKNSKGQIYGAVPPAGDGSLSVVYGPIMNAAGVDVYDAKTNTTQIASDKALEQWQAMLQFYGTASADYTTTAGDPGYDFTSGKVAMGITSRANIAGFREALKADDWDVAEIPTVDGKHPSGGGSYAMSISQTSTNTNAAWAFLAWFYQPDRGLAIAQTADGGGIIPPTLEGLKGGAWQQVSVPENMKVFAQTAKDASLTVQMPGDAGNALTAATKQAFQEVLLNKVSVKDAFTKAQQTVDAALAAAKK